MISHENQRRFGQVCSNADEDGIAPNEFIRREIQKAFLRNNPLFKATDSFFVFGFDGFDQSIFPVGSFQTREQALAFEESKRGEEHFYSSDPESDISTQFQTYTAQGVLVKPLEQATN